MNLRKKCWLNIFVILLYGSVKLYNLVCLVCLFWKPGTSKPLLSVSCLLSLVTSFRKPANSLCIVNLHCIEHRVVSVDFNFYLYFSSIIYISILLQSLIKGEKKQKIYTQNFLIFP